MATLGSIFGGTFLATRGGGKQPQGQGAQQGPPVTAGSKDEEKFIQCVFPVFPFSLVGLGYARYGRC